MGDETLMMGYPIDESSKAPGSIEKIEMVQGLLINKVACHSTVNKCYKHKKAYMSALL